MWRSEVKKSIGTPENYTIAYRTSIYLTMEFVGWGGGGRAAKKITIHEWVGYYFHVISAMRNCSIERTHETQPLKTRQIEHAQCKCLCLHSAQTYFRWKNCKMTDIGQVFFDIPSNYCTSTSVFIPLFFLISLKLTGDFALNYWKSTSTNQRVNSGANCSHQSHESLGSDLGSFVASRKAALSQIGLANTTRGAANRKESWIEEAHLNWLGMICSWLETLDTAVSEVYATMRNIANAFWMVKSRKE